MYNKKEKIYFECECLNPEHSFKFTINPEELDGLFLEVQMNPNRSLFQRVMAAIKFIFNKPFNPVYWHWDAIQLSDEDVERLYIMLHQYKVAKLKKKDNQ